MSRIVSVIAAGTVGLVLLLVAVRQVDWTSVRTAVANVSPEWLFLAALSAASAQALFAARWWVVAGSAYDWTLADAFDFLAIGAFAQLVLPNRLGDVARAVAAGRYHDTSATGLFGTIVVERVLDVLMLVCLGVALSALMSLPIFVQGGLVTLFLIVVVAVVVLWVGERGPMGMVTRWAGRRRGPGSRVQALAARFLEGTSVIRERRRMPKAFAVTLAGWSCAAMSASLTMMAFDVQAPWFAGAFAIVIINLAGILPAPPTGIGVYHYSAMMGVTPWLPDASRAFAFALVSHALSVAVVLMLGTCGLARKGLSLRGLRRMADRGSADSDSTDGRSA